MKESPIPSHISKIKVLIFKDKDMKHIISILALVMPFLAHGENVFREGTKWTTQYVGTQNPEPTYSTVSYVIDGTETVNGCDALKVFASRESDEATPEFICHLKTEGDKVFFWDAEPQCWRLFYDFGLQIGEGCYVYSLPNWNANHESVPSYMKCVGQEDNTVADGNTYLLIEKYLNDSDSMLLGSGKWLKGIGATIGIIENDRFNLEGTNSWLLEVSTADKVVFRANTTSSPTNEVCDNSVTVSTDGLNVSVYGPELTGTLEVYTCSGQHVASHPAHNGKATVALPAKGMYIVSVDNFSQKISVQ